MRGIKLIQNNSKTIEEAFEEFQKHNSIRGLSEATITTYQSSYKVFAEYYDSTELCSSLDIHVMNGFIVYLKENKEMNNTSMNIHLSSMRAFINYCIRLEYTPKFIVTMLKAEQTIKETYTESELKILLKKPDVKKCNFVTYRSWVIINYLLGTGNRESTVVNIKIGDLDFDNDSIILKKTKNKRQQIIPISNSLKIILLDYLKHRKGNNEDYLFCSITRRTIKHWCVKA